MDQEFVNALVSLSRFQDTSRAQRLLGSDKHNIDEGFYFMCGWDRLMARFRVAAATREGTAQSHSHQPGSQAYI